jgi:hypothetical protein
MTVYTESSNILHGCVKEKIGWDDAIEEAQEQIKKCQGRIKKLRNSIRLARRQKERGVPFEVSRE